MENYVEYNDTLNASFETYIFDAEKAKEFPIKCHWHYFGEILLVSCGSALIKVDDREFEAERGDVVIFYPKSIHSIEAITLPLRFKVLKFDVNRLYHYDSYAPKISTVLSVARNDRSVKVLIKAEEARSADFKRLFDSVMAEMESRRYGYDLVIRHCICTILVEIIRIWRKNGLDTSKIHLTKRDTENIDSIIEYIDANFNKPLEIPELARLCNMSYSYFAREFKQLYGRSCKSYIEFIRICKAEDLLLFTDYDLNYISFEMGFSDCSHFIKTFKKYRGITPKQFRMKMNAQ